MASGGFVGKGFEKIALEDGNQMPLLAYGLGSRNMLNGANPGLTHSEVVDATLMAIENGFYHLDAAEAYGNEAALAEALSKTTVPRSELFVASKILALPGRDIEAAFQASLERLGLDYVDICLVHFPFKVLDDLPAVWAAFERIKESGKSKSIGVSNFTVKHLETILSTAKFPPVVNSIEYHPYLQHGDLIKYCREHKIVVSAFGLFMPITKAPGGPVDGLLRDLAKKYSVTESVILLRWCIDQGIAVITTSGSSQRLQLYRDGISSFRLLPEEVQKICDAGNEKHFRFYYQDYIDAEDRG
ncbi:Aldo/keto reductase [Xylariaceae sp. FL0594]|nr:Aldo/keto reductase [Xylariaceae sp. FL0594]